MNTITGSVVAVMNVATIVVKDFVKTFSIIHILGSSFTIDVVSKASTTFDPVSLST